ncbi:hypothetical protein [Mesoplasma corruscae]|uniref:Lipoprotein n=1 Tax=Mesoplasma corruscae TaxID=216874 RepID=A0A2S5RG84_9MOLU|nr:hypothetical protein [Mesoplasma corruscae]PPE06323.1 hypothetical protein MCORR_v1c06280 [Mesoplasma corruscae]
MVLKRVLNLVTCFFIFFGFLVVSCKTELSPIKQYKPVYDFYALGQSLENKASDEFHNAIMKNQNDLIYIDPNFATNNRLVFFTQNNMKKISERKKIQNVSNNYQLLNVLEKQNLNQDLEKIVKNSNLKKTILDSMTQELGIYKEILDFPNSELWFDSISWNFDYLDFNYLDLKSENLYVSNLDLNLVFNYKYLNVNKNIIKKQYVENISITISNQQNIMKDLKYLTKDLRENLLKNKFQYAWFDAANLNINNYSKMFKLSSINFQNVLQFKKFEDSFLNYIQKKISYHERNGEINYDFIFKNSDNLFKYKLIDKISSFDIKENKYNAKKISLDDSMSTSNAKNTALFKLIFSELKAEDDIVLENKLVRGSNLLNKFLSENYNEWVNDFQKIFNEKFNTYSDSAISYGEIYLKNFGLYFKEFNYFHPVKISYYTCTSINNFNDAYLNDASYKGICIPAKDSIYKAIYQNVVDSIKIFQQAYALQKNDWKTITKASSLIILNQNNIFDLYSKSNTGISNINATLGLFIASQNSLYDLDLRNKFLDETNSYSFNFQFSSSQNKTNIPYIKTEDKKIIFTKFKNQDNLTIDINLSFLNITFEIVDENYYLFERTLLQQN